MYQSIRSCTKWLGAAALAVIFLSSCTSAPRYRSPAKVDDSPPPSEYSSVPGRQDIVHVATSYIGTPYRTGGETRNGMDCSGLVMAVYSAFDIDLPRTSLDQSRAGTPISRSDMEPGDLVFFKTSSSKPVSHVGIYIGEGKFIHASYSTRKVRVDELDNDYFRDRFVTATRVSD